MSVTGYTSAASYKAWGLFGTVLGEATKVGDLKKADPTSTKISQAALSLFALIGCVPTGGMALGAFFADRGATWISGESSTALCSVQQLRECLNQHENSLKRYETEAFNLSVSAQQYGDQGIQALQGSYQRTKGDFEPALKEQIATIRSLMEEIQAAKSQISEKNYPSINVQELSDQLERALKMTDIMFAKEHLKQLAKPSTTE